MIFLPSICHPVGEMPYQTKPHAAYWHLCTFMATGQNMAGWIKGLTAIDDFNDQFIGLVHDTDGECLLFSGAGSVRYSIHDQFIDNDTEPVAQVVAQCSFQAVVLDGGQQSGMVFFRPRKSYFKPGWYGVRIFLHRAVRVKV